MLTNEELKQLLVLNKKLGSAIEFQYIPESVLYSTEELYNLYYGGAEKVIISQNFLSCKGELIKMKEKTLEEIVTIIQDLLRTNIADYIHKTFEKFIWEYEELKYFDRDEKQYNKFKNEVLKLKEEDQ
jgi:hypothetical protein